MKASQIVKMMSDGASIRRRNDACLIVPCGSRAPIVVSCVTVDSLSRNLLIYPAYGINSDYVLTKKGRELAEKS
jgi:hypothetical protein